MKRVAILGATGSIGQSALAVVAAHPGRVKVVAMAAGENSARFAAAIAFASALLADPIKRDAFAASVGNGQSIYRAAIRHYLLHHTS